MNLNLPGSSLKGQVVLDSHQAMDWNGDWSNDAIQRHLVLVS